MRPGGAPGRGDLPWEPRLRAAVAFAAGLLCIVEPIPGGDG